MNAFEKASQDDDAKLAERLIKYAEAKTTEQADDMFRVPTSLYLDHDRWELEMANIFRRVPLLLGFSVELKENGSFKTLVVLDKPLLIIRGSDGVVRVFLNVCRHRGAELTSEPFGTCKRIVCPYHGWTYNDSGKLIGVAAKSTFGAIDQSTNGLAELPCEERGGMIFGILTPGLPINVAAWLGGMLPELEDRYDLSSWHIEGYNELPGPNWKIVFDGYLESYHFATLHTKTVFVRTMSNVMAFESFGPHQKISFPQQDILRLHELPKNEWIENNGYTSIRTLFPNVSFSFGGSFNGGQVSFVIPGPTPGTSRTMFYFMFRHPAKDEAEREMRRHLIAFYTTAVKEEDYPMGNSIQKGLQSGANSEFVFGKNELGNQRFHKWIEYFVQHEDPAFRPE